jgi:hypothetical protein
VPDLLARTGQRRLEGAIGALMLNGSKELLVRHGLKEVA